MKTARFAIVTPYYKEPRATLERCVASVRAQTVAADHFLVADGFPQDWLDAEGVTHLRLDRSWADYGNTPRGLGAMAALTRGYEGIGFLDADNWYDADHVAACVDAATGMAAPGAPVADAVFAQRRFVRYDGSVMGLDDEPDHVDTSCFWLGEGALHLAHFWMMPPELAPIGDRVYHAMFKAQDLTVARVARATVNYTCQYERFYRALGETPPPGSKALIDTVPVYRWLAGLSERRRRLVALRCGVDLVPMAVESLRRSGLLGVPPGRNDLCSCGSGRKYKYCHGVL